MVIVGEGQTPLFISPRRISPRETADEPDSSVAAAIERYRDDGIFQDAVFIPGAAGDY